MGCPEASLELALLTSRFKIYTYDSNRGSAPEPGKDGVFRRWVAVLTGGSRLV